MEDANVWQIRECREPEIISCRRINVTFEALTDVKTNTVSIPDSNGKSAVLTRTARREFAEDQTTLFNFEVLHFGLGHISRVCRSISIPVFSPFLRHRESWVVLQHSRFSNLNLRNCLASFTSALGMPRMRKLDLFTIVGAIAMSWSTSPWNKWR